MSTNIRVLLFVFVLLFAGCCNKAQANDFADEMECLAKNVYFEARGESYNGKLAVAQVTINRTESGKFPDTVCGVVHQSTVKNNKKICQFSWACDKSVKLKRDSKHWEEAEDIAFNVLLGRIGHSIIESSGALYFHSKRVLPSWADVKRRVATIGNHVFYNDNNKRKRSNAKQNQSGSIREG